MTLTTANRPARRAPRYRRRPRRQGGFTLIEVLVTILLLSIVIPVAMMATTQALKMADTAKQKSTAAALAEGKIAELIATGDWQNGALSGDCTEDHPGFFWQGGVVNWTEANLQELDVKVYWGPGPDDPATSVTVSTLVYVNNADAAAASGTDTTGGTQ